MSPSRPASAWRSFVFSAGRGRTVRPISLRRWHDMSRGSQLIWGSTGRIFTTIAATPINRSRSTQTATTSGQPPAPPIPSASRRSTPASFSDLPQPRLFRFLLHHACGVLAAAAAGAERAAAGGELRLLRLGARVVADPAVRHHVRRLLGGASHDARASAPHAVALAEHRQQPRPAGRLQVLQLLY